MQSWHYPRLWLWPSPPGDGDGPPTNAVATDRIVCCSDGNTQMVANHRHLICRHNGIGDFIGQSAGWIIAHMARKRPNRARVIKFCKIDYYFIIARCRRESKVVALQVGSDRGTVRKAKGSQRRLIIIRVSHVDPQPACGNANARIHRIKRIGPVGDADGALIDKEQLVLIGWPKAGKSHARAGAARQYTAQSV